MSGCYDPGTFWLFPGRERDAVGGPFDQAREITDVDGAPLRRVPDQKEKSDSYEN